MESEKGISPVLSNHGSDEVGYVGSEDNNNKVQETKRGLSARHVQLMAIGGSIGTGLWVCNLKSYPTYSSNEVVV